MSDFFARMGVLGELMSFLWARKLYWLIPMIVTLLIIAVFILVNTAVPGIGYTLF